jgi:DNA-binding LacI/PurR family transcriptional regulator
MRATINDIAKKAGVSKTTVSFAFNSPSKISKETCARIMEIAREIGYMPDPVARTLATRQTGSIGLLLPQTVQEIFLNPYISEILRGVGAVCDREGISLGVFSPLKGALAQTIRNAAVDGIITVGIGPGMDVLDIFYLRGLPFVTVDGAFRDAPVPGDPVNVGIDDALAAESLMDAVLDSGHRDIACLTLENVAISENGDFFSRTSDARLAGFNRSIARHGLAAGGACALSALRTPATIAGGREAARQLLDGERRPSVIVCLADAQALGVYDECRARGLAIPDDLSVTGFDDIPFGELLSPPLTTVRQPGFAKGETAARLLVDLINRRPAASQVLPATFVPRGSLGKR